MSKQSSPDPKLSAKQLEIEKKEKYMAELKRSTNVRKLRNSLVVNNYFNILAGIFLFFSLVTPMVVRSPSINGYDSEGSFASNQLNGLNAQYPLESECDEMQVNYKAWLRAWGLNQKPGKFLSFFIADTDTPFVFYAGFMPVRCDFQNNDDGSVVSLGSTINSLDSNFPLSLAKYESDPLTLAGEVFVSTIVFNYRSFNAELAFDDLCVRLVILFSLIICLKLMMLDTKQFCLLPLKKLMQIAFAYSQNPLSRVDVAKLTDDMVDVEGESETKQVGE